jgi:hypothetical protein
MLSQAVGVMSMNDAVNSSVSLKSIGEKPQQLCYPLGLSKYLAYNALVADS